MINHVEVGGCQISRCPKVMQIFRIRLENHLHIPHFLSKYINIITVHVFIYSFSSCFPITSMVYN